MNIQINCSDFEVTDKIKEQLDTRLIKKLETLLKRFDTSVLNGNIHLKQLTHTKEYQTTFEMAIPGKESLYASHTHKFLLSSITGLREQLERQIEKIRQD